MPIAIAKLLLLPIFGTIAIAKYPPKTIAIAIDKCLLHKTIAIAID